MNMMSMNNPMNNPMMGGMMPPPFLPNYGLGPNDSMNMFNSMLNIFNNNSFNNRPTSTGYFPGMRTPAPSPFVFEPVERNRIDNMNFPMMPPMMGMGMGMPPMNFMMNLNMFMNNMNNLNIRESFDDDNIDKKDIKRNESLDVKMDVDNLLKSKNELDRKNKNIQYILNYIPFTIIKDVPEQKEDEPHCLICLCNYEVGEKVSALPCFHTFHTKCIDEWITRSAKCPVCKFQITLKNLIGEDFIKEHLKLIEKAKEEEERKEKERKEKEKREKERLEREKKEKERLEREKKEKERIEREKKEKERKEKLERERKEKIEKERKERIQRDKERRERIEKERKERIEKERKEKEQKEQKQKNDTLKSKFSNYKKINLPKKNK